MIKMEDNKIIINELNVVELSTSEIQQVEGGSFWNAVFEVFETIVQYSSLTGALIVGVANGISDGIQAQNKNT